MSILGNIKSALKEAITPKVALAPSRAPGRVNVVVEKLVKVTAGGSHGWYESNVGLIRKPLKNYGI